MEAVKSLFAPKDLTQGTPWKRIVEFTIPMLIGNVVQQFYNTADSIIVGRYIGDNALAAVGSAAPILNLLLVLFVGISVGAGILVSQYFGAKNREQLSRTIGTCITLTAIASLIIMIVGPLVSGPLLRLLKTPPSIIEWCADYLYVFFLGIAGFMYYNMLAGILRGLGDSASALLFLFISTVLNVVLDIWFVASFGLGVPGVALATVIAQGISGILCLWKLMKMKDSFDLNWAVLKPDKDLAVRLIKLGLPSGLTQAIFSLAMIVVQSLTNSFGEMVIACNVIVMRVDGFAMMPNFSFGAAMTTFTGQNIGAQKLDRVEEGALTGTKIAVAVSAVITIIILLLGRYLVNIFTDTAELVDLSMHDENSRLRLCCNGGNAELSRSYAQCWRYDDTDVDFSLYYRCTPCSNGLRNRILNQKRAVSDRKARVNFLFTVDLMDLRSSCYLCFLPPGQMA